MKNNKINLNGIYGLHRIMFGFRFFRPCLVYETFDQIELPIKKRLNKEYEIKGIVVDKDNCIMKDGSNRLVSGYESKWRELCGIYGAKNVLIVSNSAGSADDKENIDANFIEKEIGVGVFLHKKKKPECHVEVLSHFKKLGIKAEEIAVIGDRIFTDVLMANVMNSQAIWLKTGVELQKGIFFRIERAFYKHILRGLKNNIN